MRIAIIGSRNFPDLNLVREYVRSLPSDTTVISGGARGVDRAAVAEARRRGLHTIVYPADWTRYGRRAGFIRNNEIMATKPDAVMAFWDGASRGTPHALQCARALDIPDIQCRVLKP